MSLTSRLLLHTILSPPSAIRQVSKLHTLLLHTTMPASLVSLIFAMVRQNNSFENMSVHLLFSPFSRVCAHSLKLALHTGSEIFSDILANNFPSIRHISREYPWRFSIHPVEVIQHASNTNQHQHRRSNIQHPLMDYGMADEDSLSLLELLLLAFLFSTSYPITIYALAV